tara:strand:- start:3205 stop:3312 length:108 start_codon:yes stop_codon:yes gene_type:complete
MELVEPMVQAVLMEAQDHQVQTALQDQVELMEHPV